MRQTQTHGLLSDFRSRKSPQTSSPEGWLYVSKATRRLGDSRGAAHESPSSSLVLVLVPVLVLVLVLVSTRARVWCWC